MKYINKTNAPERYSTWCQTQQEIGVNYNFRSLQNPEKEALHQSLIQEQGQLCPYTMKRISYQTSHLEHICPQNRCPPGSGLDLAYTNLLACFPNNRNSQTNCPFGAVRKDSWWDNEGNDFISPLNESCELKFCFTIDGIISPTNNQSNSANTTIMVLNLNDNSLTNDRRQSIEAFLYGDDPEDPTPLSPQDANRAIGEVVLRRSDGSFVEYCIALHDALYEYLEILERQSNNNN